MRPTAGQTGCLLALALALMFLASPVSHAADKGAGDPLLGTWVGHLTERGKKHSFGITLKSTGGTLSGVFTMLSSAGGDVKKGATRPLVGIYRGGPHLVFVVLISGKLDRDSLFFYLTLKGQSLRGYTCELRNPRKKFDLDLKRQD